MKPGLYLVECFACGDWMPLAKWRIVPADFSRFLDHLYRILKATDSQESKNMLRVKRILVGQADWEFVGHGHIEAHEAQ